jgi:hypothetical protein
MEEKEQSGIIVKVLVPRPITDIFAISQKPHV